MKYFFRLDTVIVTALVFVTVYTLFWVPTNFSFLSPMQQALSDFELTDMAFSTFRDSTNEKHFGVDTNIVVVNIGLLGRDGIAEVISKVAAWKPKVVGVDAFFRNPKDSLSDASLMNALSSCKCLVMGTELVYNDSLERFDSIRTSNKMFTQFETSSGFLNVISDDESSFRTVREFSPYEVVNSDTVLNFATTIAKHFREKPYTDLLQRANTTEIINFKGNLQNFYSLDYSELLTNEDCSFLEGKIVLLGYLGDEIKEDYQVHTLEDVFYTPLNSRYAGKSFPDMYGVVVHANVISQILQGHYIDKMSVAASIILAVFLVLVNIGLFNFMEQKLVKFYDAYTILSILGQSILFTYFLIVVFNKYQYKLNLTIPLAAIALTPTMHEIYHNSLKPLMKEFLLKIRFTKTASSSAVGVIIFLFFYVGLVAQTPMLKVLSVKGKVTNQKNKDIKTGNKLINGDKIIVADKASITVLNTNGKSITINKASTTEVSMLIAQSNKGTSVSKKFASYVYNELSETSDDPSADKHKSKMKTTGSVERATGDRKTNVDALSQMLESAGVLNGEESLLSASAKNSIESALSDKQLVVVMPRSSYLLDNEVTFSWQPLPTVTDYKLVILRNDGSIHYTSTTQTNQVTLNTVSSGFVSGMNYYWHVENAKDAQCKSTEYCIQVLPSEKAKAYRDTLAMIDQEFESSTFAEIVKAQYAEDMGLHNKAVDLYNTALRESSSEDYRKYYRNYLRRLNILKED